jgi:hypothetical protein
MLSQTVTMKLSVMDGLEANSKPAEPMPNYYLIFHYTHFITGFPALLKLGYSMITTLTKWAWVINLPASCLTMYYGIVALEWSTL